jgi:DegV family protein with EDD domain
MGGAFMSKIMITMDSTCDLPKEIIEKYNIQVVPVYVNIDEASYRDKIDITNKEIYDAIDSGKDVKTSSGNLFDYIVCFEEQIKQGYEIIHISIGDKLSQGCFNNSVIAANELGNDKVHVINSKNLSVGSALITLGAVDLKNEDKTPAEIEKILLNEYIPNVSSHYLLTNTKQLVKSGRCNSAIALLTNLISARIRIDVIDGLIEKSSPAFISGKMDIAAKTFIKKELENRFLMDAQRIIFSTSGCSLEAIKELKTMIENVEYYKEIICVEAGPGLSTHAGRTVAIGTQKIYK